MIPQRRLFTSKCNLLSLMCLLFLVVLVLSFFRFITTDEIEGIISRQHALCLLVLKSSLLVYLFGCFILPVPLIIQTINNKLTIDRYACIVLHSCLNMLRMKKTFDTLKRMAHLCHPILFVNLLLFSRVLRVCSSLSAFGNTFLYKSGVVKHKKKHQEKPDRDGKGRGADIIKMYYRCQGISTIHPSPAPHTTTISTLLFLFFRRIFIVMTILFGAIHCVLMMRMSDPSTISTTMMFTTTSTTSATTRTISAAASAVVVVGANAQVVLSSANYAIDGTVVRNGNYGSQYMIHCPATATSKLTWNLIRDDCRDKLGGGEYGNDIDKTFQGGGWLFASMNSSAGSDALQRIIAIGMVWTGGSDWQEIMKWRWHQGRLQGQVFYIRKTPYVAADPGTPQPGFFQQWNTNEPNEQVTSAINVRSDRVWHDQPLTPSYDIRCYACERSPCEVHLDCNSATTDRASGYWPHCGCFCREGFSGPRCENTSVTVNIVPSSGNEYPYLSEFTLQCAGTRVAWGGARNLCRAKRSSNPFSSYNAGWELASLPSNTVRQAILTQLLTGVEVSDRGPGSGGVDRTVWIGGSRASRAAAASTPPQPSWTWAFGRLEDQTVDTASLNTWAAGEPTTFSFSSTAGTLQEQFLGLEITTGLMTTHIQQYSAVASRSPDDVVANRIARCAVCERTLCTSSALYQQIKSFLIIPNGRLYPSTPPPANQPGAMLRRTNASAYFPNCSGSESLSISASALVSLSRTAAHTESSSMTASQRASVSRTSVHTATRSVLHTTSKTQRSSTTATRSKISITFSLSPRRTKTVPTATGTLTITASASPPLTASKTLRQTETPSASVTLRPTRSGMTSSNSGPLQTRTTTLSRTVNRTQSRSFIPTSTTTATWTLELAHTRSTTTSATKTLPVIIPKTPPTAAETVRAGAESATGIVAAAGGAFANPASMGQQGVALALIRMAKCGGNDDNEDDDDENSGQPLSMLVHPLQFALPLTTSAASSSSSSPAAAEAMPIPPPTTSSSVVGSDNSSSSSGGADTEEDKVAAALEAMEALVRQRRPPIFQYERGAVVGNLFIIPIVYALVVQGVARLLLPRIIHLSSAHNNSGIIKNPAATAQHHRHVAFIGWPSIGLLPLIATAEGTGMAVTTLFIGSIQFFADRHNPAVVHSTTTAAGIDFVLSLVAIAIVSMVCGGWVRVLWRVVPNIYTLLWVHNQRPVTLFSSRNNSDNTGRMKQTSLFRSIYIILHCLLVYPAAYYSRGSKNHQNNNKKDLLGRGGKKMGILDESGSLAAPLNGNNQKDGDEEGDDDDLLDRPVAHTSRFSWFVTPRAEWEARPDADTTTTTGTGTGTLPKNSNDNDDRSQDHPSSSGPVSLPLPLPLPAPPPIHMPSPARQDEAARWVHCVGDKWVGWAEFTCFACSLFVGIAEGLPSGSRLQCRIRVCAAFFAALLQALLVLTTTVPLEFVLLGATFSTTLMLACITLYITFSDSVAPEALETLQISGAVGNIFSLFLMLAGVARLFLRVNTMRDRVRLSRERAQTIATQPAPPVVLFEFSGDRNDRGSDYNSDLELSLLSIGQLSSSATPLPSSPATRPSTPKADTPAIQCENDDRPQTAADRALDEKISTFLVDVRQEQADAAIRRRAAKRRQGLLPIENTAVATAVATANHFGHLNLGPHMPQAASAQNRNGPGQQQQQEALLQRKAGRVKTPQQQNYISPPRRIDASKVIKVTNAEGREEIYHLPNSSDDEEQTPKKYGDDEANVHDEDAAPRPSSYPYRRPPPPAGMMMMMSDDTSFHQPNDHHRHHHQLTHHNSATAEGELPTPLRNTRESQSVLFAGGGGQQPMEAVVECDPAPATYVRLHVSQIPETTRPMQKPRNEWEEKMARLIDDASL